MNKQQVRDRIVEIGIVPVVRASSASEARIAAEAVCQGGIPIVEVTMTVPGAVDVIRELVKTSGAEVLVGRVPVVGEDPEALRTEPGPCLARRVDRDQSQDHQDHQSRGQREDPEPSVRDEPRRSLPLRQACGEGGSVSGHRLLSERPRGTGGNRPPLSFTFAGCYVLAVLELVEPDEPPPSCLS